MTTVTSILAMVWKVSILILMEWADNELIQRHCIRGRFVSILILMEWADNVSVSNCGCLLSLCFNPNFNGMGWQCVCFLSEKKDFLGVSILILMEWADNVDDFSIHIVPSPKFQS